MNCPARGRDIFVSRMARAGQICAGNSAASVISAVPSSRPPISRAGLGARRRSHLREERDVGFDDPCPFAVVRFERPDAALRGASERDAIAARHHVNSKDVRRSRRQAAGCLVGDLRLGEQQCQLLAAAYMAASPLTSASAEADCAE